MSPIMKMLRRLAASLPPLLWALPLAIAVPAAQAADTGAEARLVKVAYLYNFTKFTRWPAHTGVEDKVPLNFCTLGDDEVVQALGQVSGKRVKGNPIAILAMAAPEGLDRCHLLYVATSERFRHEKILQSIMSMPILTVSEIPGFARTGGMIELFREQDRIRFIINVKAARDTGLEISPNLLALAIVIARDNTP